MKAMTRLRRGVKYLGYVLAGAAVLLVGLSYRDGAPRSALADDAGMTMTGREGASEKPSTEVVEVQEQGDSRVPGVGAGQISNESTLDLFDGQTEGLFNGATVYIVSGQNVGETNAVQAREEAHSEGAREPSAPDALGNTEEGVPERIASLLEQQAPRGVTDAPPRMPEPIGRLESIEVTAQRVNGETAQSPAFMDAFQALLSAPELESLLTSGFTVRERNGGTTTLTHASGVVADFERTTDSQAITLKASGRSGERETIKLEVERALRSFAGEPEDYRGENTWFFGESAVSSTSNERVYQVSFTPNELVNVPIGVTTKTSESE